MMSISVARLPKLAFLTLYRRRTTKNVSFTYMKLPHRMSLYLLRFWSDTSTDPSFCPLHTLSLIPQCPMWSSLVTCRCYEAGFPGGRRPPGRPWPCALVPDQLADLESPPPPELGDRSWPMGCKPDHVHWFQTNAPVHSDQIGMGSPGRMGSRPFLPRSPSPPPPL